MVTRLPFIVQTGGDACQPTQVPDTDGELSTTATHGRSQATLVHAVISDVHAGRYDEWSTQVNADANATR